MSYGLASTTAVFNSAAWVLPTFYFKSLPVPPTHACAPFPMFGLKVESAADVKRVADLLRHHGAKDTDLW